MLLAEQGGMLRLALLFLLTGCVGDLVELTPGSKGDMAQAPQPQPDLAEPPASPDGGGGGDVDLAQPVQTLHFDPTIQADIDNLGCSASSCHGGTQVPVLKRLPATDADKTANYNAFKAEAMNGANSNVLVKNLAGSGVTHTGGSSFASTQDPIYQRWLTWINEGNPQ